MKKIFFSIGFAMFVFAIFFIFFAFNHPECSWKFDLKIVYLIYILYLIVMFIMFLLAFVKKSKNDKI